jgi:hypothetical protein
MRRATLRWFVVAEAFMDIAGWISLAINGAFLVLFFVGRKLIETNVTKSVEHKFDTKLEATKSDLRAKETEISALLDMVLSGRTQRQALLDKRKIEAVEAIWVAVGKLAPFALASASMARIKFDKAAEKAPRDPNLRKFFAVIADPSLINNLDKEKTAMREQPFLSPLAWAYFSAYQSIVMGAYMEARMLAEGVEDAGKLLKRYHAKDLLKVTLPHQNDFIENNDPRAYYFLLDELRDCLLAELRKMLEGHDVDRTTIDQAKRISNAINKIDNDAVDEKMAGLKADGFVLKAGAPTPT